MNRLTRRVAFRDPVCMMALVTPSIFALAYQLTAAADGAASGARLSSRDASMTAVTLLTMAGTAVAALVGFRLAHRSEGSGFLADVMMAMRSPVALVRDVIGIGWVFGAASVAPVFVWRLLSDGPAVPRADLADVVTFFVLSIPIGAVMGSRVGLLAQSAAQAAVPMIFAPVLPIAVMIAAPVTTNEVIANLVFVGIMLTINFAVAALTVKALRKVCASDPS